MKDIIDSILDNFVKLSCHSNGIYLIKKLISCHKNLQIIQKIITDNFNILILDVYGNITIQEAIHNKNLQIIELFYGRFHELSMKKYSSNAVEKCLEVGKDVVLQEFFEEVRPKTKLLGNI
jgi:hypothetical protein